MIEHEPLPEKRRREEDKALLWLEEIEDEYEFYHSHMRIPLTTKDQLEIWKRRTTRYHTLASALAKVIGCQN